MGQILKARQTGNALKLHHSPGHAFHTGDQSLLLDGIETAGDGQYPGGGAYQEHLQGQGPVRQLGSQFGGEGLRGQLSLKGRHILVAEVLL